MRLFLKIRWAASKQGFNKTSTLKSISFYSNNNFVSILIRNNFDSFVNSFRLSTEGKTTHHNLSLYSPYYAEARTSLRCLSLRYSAKVTQLLA